MLIGLTGKKRRGKDTVANYLVEKYGFNKHGLADKVKEYAYAINPLIPVPYSSYQDEPIRAWEEIFNSLDGTRFFRLQLLVDELGWEKSKEIPEVRAILQRVGTEGGRRIFTPLVPDQRFWIELLFKQLEAKYGVYYSDVHTIGLQSKIVVSDVRFDNEAEAIKKYGGLVILVDSNREGLPAPDNHASETGVNPKLLDGTLHNDGTVDDLYTGVDEVMQYLGVGMKI